MQSRYSEPVTKNFQPAQAQKKDGCSSKWSSLLLRGVQEAAPLFLSSDGKTAWMSGELVSFSDQGICEVAIMKDNNLDHVVGSLEMGTKIRSTDFNGKKGQLWTVLLHKLSPVGNNGLFWEASSLVWQKTAPMMFISFDEMDTRVWLSGEATANKALGEGNWDVKILKSDSSEYLEGPVVVDGDTMGPAEFDRATGVLADGSLSSLEVISPTKSVQITKTVSSARVVSVQGLSNVEAVRNAKYPSAVAPRLHSEFGSDADAGVH